MNASILPKLSFEKNKKIMNIENSIMQIIIDSLLQYNSVLQFCAASFTQKQSECMMVMTDLHGKLSLLNSF